MAGLKPLPQLRPDHDRFEVRYAGARVRNSSPARRQLSNFVVARDGRRECGSKHYLAAHHVIPRVEGGPDHPSNFVAVCVTCHRAETAREHAEQRR